MGQFWLWDMPDICRAAGLTVDTYPGWESRARSTGGYDGLFAVQVHHTASNTTPASDMNYMWNGSPDRPIGAIYLARDGRVTIGAAGATNTSGKGGPLGTSRGTIPLDAANRYVISIEAANNGTGQVWPKEQTDAYVKLVRALCDAYGIKVQPGDVHAHFEWTSRKIDPAGSSVYATGANKWDMNWFRSDVAKPTVPPVKYDIYAGIDTNGKNYNVNEWIVPSGGAGLVWQDGTLRCCQLRDGVVTLGIQNPMSYNRPLLTRTLTVPYTVSGMIFLHSRATDPFILGENRVPTWDWAPNLHPVFVDEDNNVVSGLSPTVNRWSASGQINKVYGIPRKEIYVADMNHDAQMGAWHHFRMHVPRVGTHEIYWDDVLVYRVVEKDPPDGPAAWWPRSLHAALRLDFYDYSLKDLDPGPIAPPTQGDDIDMIGIDWRKGTPQYTGLVSTGTQLAWAFDGNAYGVYINAGMKSQAVNDTQLDALIKSSQTTTDCPPTFTGARRTLWNEQRG